MATTNEHELKERLLGAVEKPARTGDHMPDKVELSAPCARGGVVRTFCTGCGNTLEIIPNGGRLLAEKSGNPISDIEELRGKFFEVESCFYCDDGFLGSIRMRDIDELN